MAVFDSSFQGEARTVARFQRITASLVRKGSSDTPRTVGGPNAAGRSWEVEKAIPDILIEDGQDGSWIMIVGTPLPSAPMLAAAGEPGFLRDFLLDPADSIRTHLDGCFALIAYDGTKQRLIAASDSNRTVPLFYAVTPTGAYLGSSELALARLLGAEIDPHGFAQTIYLGTPWGTRTRFAGISMLAPASMLTIDMNLVANESPYWQPRDEVVWKGGLDRILDKWSPLLARAVERYGGYKGDEPLLADLTAGEDARLVLAQCHALGIDFHAHVGGFPEDQDVEVVEQAAKNLGFPHTVTRYCLIEPAQLKAHAEEIVLASDGYANFFTTCIGFATGLQGETYDRAAIKLSGMPGGEAFRGAYYYRAKLLFPTLKGHFEPRFFTRLKYLLDTQRGLLRFSDETFLAGVHSDVAAALQEVESFPDGTQVDHLLRLFQTCSWGMIHRKPAYLPLASADLTRSIYSLPPKVKKRGMLTRALTERLFTKLAWIKTQNGVPTVRRSLSRLPLFLPEYLTGLQAVWRGFNSRVLKRNQTGRSLKRYLRLDYNRNVFQTLFNEAPFREIFQSSETMKTGHLYDPVALNEILDNARAGHCRSLNLMSRIISQELAYRWVCNLSIGQEQNPLGGDVLRPAQWQRPLGHVSADAAE
ncbi:MAG: hypothetical protein ACTSX7_07050 [Alphaproteobacteria bacterium]